MNVTHQGILYRLHKKLKCLFASFHLISSSTSLCISHQERKVQNDVNPEVLEGIFVFYADAATRERRAKRKEPIALGTKVGFARALSKLEIDVDRKASYND